MHRSNFLVMCAVGAALYSGCSKPPMSTSQATSTSNTTEATTVSDDSATITDEPEFAPAPEGKVLRHAVFFSFKEDSSEEDVQRIVDAFRELPSKIEEIIDFTWGTNNSPEGLNDGFTHCFLLTFKDEAGRAAYLPHEAHKAFGDVLRGHNDKVFVIDYWGNAEEAALDKKLKHAVFFRFKQDAAPEDIKKVEEAFAALPSKIDTIKDFEWGTNNSPEKHDAGFTHCFMVTFDSEEGRATYLPHEDHLAFVEILKPVLDAPRVLDFWAEK
ncbi:MAG: Dabb family protein [Planctomycetales bacterium]|nr:Dabb family protein [Planctomycetales bacterium]